MPTLPLRADQVNARRPLFFGHGNSKLDEAIFTFSLPAGHSCPFADACRSRAHRETGRIADGENTEFRCYAATAEARHSSVRRSRWRNWEALRACRSKKEMTQLILDSLSPFAGFVRLHDAGDFYAQDYFDVWLGVARLREHTTFYAYTKSLSYWTRRLAEVGTGHEPGKLANVVLTASFGGGQDHLIERYHLRSARVVFSVAEADALGLPLDHDDGHAMTHGPDFALLLHGTQPPGSEAAKALAELHDRGFYGYGPRANARRRSLPVV